MLDAIILQVKQSEAVVQSLYYWKLLICVSLKALLAKHCNQFPLQHMSIQILLDLTLKIAQFQIGCMSSPRVKQRGEFKDQVIKSMSTSFYHNTPVKEEIFQIVMNNEFPFLEMKMNWAPEGELKLSVLR